MKPKKNNDKSHLLLDQMLDDYNMNKPIGKPAFDRGSFGKSLLKNRTAGNIKATLSTWASKKIKGIPPYFTAVRICEIIGISIDEYNKKYIRQ